MNRVARRGSIECIVAACPGKQIVQDLYAPAQCVYAAI